MRKKTNADELLAILEMLPSHIYWLDTENRICGCNKEQALAAGFQTPEEMIGKTDYDMPWREFADKIVAVNNKVMKLKISHTVEEEVFLPDGQRIVYLSTKMPRYNEKNEVIGILGVSIDITERKKMEEELKRSKEKAEDAEKKAEASRFIMTELISNLGHDFITPLSDIGMAVYMLETFKDEVPQFSEYIDLLKERYEASEIVRKRFIDATSLSRLEINNIEKVYITEVLLRLEKKFRDTLKAKHLKLIIQPIKPKTDDFVLTDRVKFTAILDQLLDNAIKFTDKGQITIIVSKDIEKEMILIQIIDTGIGIPSDKLGYIFEQYTKISRSNKHGVDFKGVGAGLFLVRIIAHILKATIKVISELNKGSTFTLTIPVYLTPD